MAPFAEELDYCAKEYGIFFSVGYKMLLKVSKSWSCVLGLYYTQKCKEGNSK